MGSDLPNDDNASPSKGKAIVFESDLHGEELNNEASNEVDDAPKNVVFGDAKKSNAGVIPPSVPLKPQPKVTPQFPQRLKKRNEDVKFQNFLSVFKALSINLPLVEALLEMSGYEKFMKVLVTK